MVKILIIGAGAIGCYYGAKLGLAGAEIHMWCRSNYSLIKKNGIFIKSYQGDFMFKPHKIYENLQDINENFDYILIATKALLELDLFSLIKNFIHENVKIILIQNGIFIENALSSKLPSNEIITAIAFIAVSRLKDGIIFHQDFGKLIIGTYQKPHSQSVKLIANLLQKAEVEVEISDNMQKERWKKLVWNSAFNPLSVVLGKKDTTQMMSNDYTKKLAQNIMQEICVLAKIDNCELPKDVIEKNIEATIKMRPYKTSMLLDYENNRSLEIDAIIGNVVRFAEEKSISLPYLSTIYTILLNLISSK